VQNRLRQHKPWQFVGYPLTGERIVSYVEDMKAEADKRREEATLAAGEELRAWLLQRAAFFDQCAAEAEKPHEG
jgi:hypothetical protein